MGIRRVAFAVGVSLALWTACGKSSRTEDLEGTGTSATAPPAPTTAVPTPVADDARDACDSLSLARKLTTAWQLRDDQKVEVIACSRGHFPDAALAVLAYVDTVGKNADDEGESVLRHAIVLASGELIADAVPENVAPVMRKLDMMLSNLATADFDGDKTDEVLYHQDVNHGGGMSTTLRIYRRDKSALTRLFQIDTSYESGEEEGESCEVAVELGEPDREGKRELRLVGSPDNQGSSDECVKGRRSYRLVDGKVVAQP